MRRKPWCAPRQAPRWGKSLVTIAVMAALSLAACGGGEGRISSLDEAKSGVIRIVTTGSFEDPQVGLQLNQAGSGSGFIIHPSGIAVTNNHVVTGAATIEVFVGGSDRPVNAKVLGVSECADLAVIDLDGEGYPYFEWYPDEIDVNLDVRAAGFPLWTSEFTLTRGIISKASADGESVWASVDAVIEHDARINPGNSGGPLLDDLGRVVGVNYAGNANTAQSFAIAASLAKGVVNQLAEGKDVDSIGINGRAIYGESPEFGGVWVASVKTGSPASAAGIKSGDIILRMENLSLASEGTMKEYCDVLRTRGSDDVLKVEVLRYATEEVLEGELNGRPLEPSFSFAQSFGGQLGGQAGGGSYAEYVEVTDDSGLLSMEVPAAWGDVDGATTDEGEPTLTASPDLAAYETNWDIPGVFFTASTELAAESDETVLGLFDDRECEAQDPQPYEDPLYTGTVKYFSSCGGTTNARAIVVARPADNRFVAVVDMVLVSDADLEALDRVMNTFQVHAEADTTESR